MPWVRFDDQYDIHRKVDALSDAGYRLHNKSLFWCARNTTDGVIRRHELKQVWAKATDRLAAEIVARELWHLPGHGCKDCTQPLDGWVVHDYLDYQPSKSQVEKDRQAKTERQRKWRNAKRGVDARVDASRNGTVDVPTGTSTSDLVDVPVDAAQGDATPRVTYPAPPRPAPKEAGRGDPPRAATARRQAADAAGGGRAKPNGSRSPSHDWGEDPAIADADRERLRLEAEAAVAAIHHQQQRVQAGAAAARAAIRRPGKPAPRDAMAELRALTPSIPVPDQEDPAPDQPQPAQETP